MLYRFCLLAVISLGVSGAERDALAIDANLRARHMPFGTVLDPIFTNPSSDQIAGYTRCGDSALWTGAYLAAESFRYKTAPSADALGNVRAALAGLKALADVTGDNRLARCMVPAASPYAQGIASEEAHNTVNHNGDWLWIDNTSRDQMVGALFGLGVAYDFVDAADVRDAAAALITRLAGYMASHRWSPNDDPDSTFELRPEGLRMILGLSKHVDAAHAPGSPLIVLPVQTAVGVDVLSDDSYFKFNLDYMSLFHLLRLDPGGSNQSAYSIVRNHTAQHRNAFFNMVDRALNGPNLDRDAETRQLLDQWLARPRRDVAVDLTQSVRVCGDVACQPVPVPLRVPTDFLWQRNPYQLSGGGTGLIEGAGIDYLLPYWMARFYGVISGAASTPSVQPAAAPGSSVAPDSLASMFGADLAATTAKAAGTPLPFQLGGVSLTVKDSAGNSIPAPLLYVSPTQINFLVPANAAPGPATFAAGNQQATAPISTVAPVLFSMDGTGSGVAAATAIQVQVANPALRGDVPVFQCSASGCVPVPIPIGIDTPIYVTFYGTGLRNRSAISAVTCTINGISVPVLYAGPSPGSPGLDQVNVSLTLALRGAGDAKVIVTVDGRASNAVLINIR